MEFDFLAYVQTHLGSHYADSGKITISKLTGGLTNWTARASFNTPVPLSLISKESVDTSGDNLLASVVLKYAPPHIASDPSQPLSVHRQHVEAVALQILGPLLPGTMLNHGQNGGSSGRFHTPSMFYHDKVNNVLWMEDLGTDAISLTRYLSTSPPAITPEEAEGMGKGLGQVIHNLQKTTSVWIDSPPDSLVDFQTSASEEIHTYLSQLTLKELRKGGMDETEAERLSGIVLKGLRELRNEEMFWGMGDFWPESVLVHRESASSQIKFGLIDWEYFGPSSVPAEMGMFLAHLHYHMLSSNDVESQHRIRAFANGMCCGYTDARLSSNMEPDVYPSKAFQWKVLTAYGRELINAIQLYNEDGHNDELVDSRFKETRARVVHIGVMSIQAAGSTWADVDLGCLVGTGPDPICGTESIGSGIDDIPKSRWICEAFDALRFRVDRRVEE